MLSAFRNIVVGILRHWKLAVALAVAFAIYSGERNDWIRLTTTAMILTGIVANIVVIAANGGRMPVLLDPGHSIAEEDENTYRIMDSKTRLAFLGDWIDVSGWLLSPGDVSLYAGIAFVIAARIVELFVGMT